MDLSNKMDQLQRVFDLAKDLRDVKNAKGLNNTMMRDAVIRLCMEVDTVEHETNSSLKVKR